MSPSPVIRAQRDKRGGYRFLLLLLIPPILLMSISAAEVRAPGRGVSLALTYAALAVAVAILIRIRARRRAAFLRSLAARRARTVRAWVVPPVAGLALSRSAVCRVVAAPEGIELWKDSLLGMASLLWRVPWRGVADIAMGNVSSPATNVARPEPIITCADGSIVRLFVLTDGVLGLPADPAPTLAALLDARLAASGS